MATDQVKVRFDPDADILYIRVKRGAIVDTKPLAEDVYADLDSNGSILGIEIWRASQLAISPIAKAVTENIRKFATR